MGRKRQSYFFPWVLEVIAVAEYCSKFWQSKIKLLWVAKSLFSNQCFFPQQPLTCISYPLGVIYIIIIALFACKYQEFKTEQNNLSLLCRSSCFPSHITPPLACLTTREMVIVKLFLHDPNCYVLLACSVMFVCLFLSVMSPLRMVRCLCLAMPPLCLQMLCPVTWIGML